MMPTHNSLNSVTLWGFTCRLNILPHTRAPKGQESICNWHCRRAEQFLKAYSHQNMWPRSHFFWESVSLTYNQRRRSMLATSPSRCLVNGLILFWEAVTSPEVDLRCSRLLRLLAHKAVVTGRSSPWPLGLFSFFFWCETTCKLRH